MKLAISNIGWAGENDGAVYEMMKELSYTGLEIAPTRIFPEAPYERIKEAGEWADRMDKEEGFCIPSMQSIWYGKNELLFGSDEDREALITYTKKAIDFAEAIGCKNLVFGCPRNRKLPEGGDPEIGVRFFKELGDYALEHDTVLAMEANPPIYNTNYINDTGSALELIRKVDSGGFKLNLDLGTMIENKEPVSVLKGMEGYINHVHVSEPGLKAIEKREIHKELADFLLDVSYDKFVSIEVGRQDDINSLYEMMKYVKGVFG